MLHNQDMLALKVIKKAIELKEKMSCERGMYSFYFLSSDNTLDEERATIPGGEEPIEKIIVFLQGSSVGL